MEGFSPDGGFLVTGAAREGWIRVLDAESGRPVGVMLRHFARNGNALGAAPYGHVEFSASGRRLVVLCQNGDIHVWNIDWLRDGSGLTPEEEWERAQLAGMRTLDDEGIERQIPIEEWQKRRDAWLRAHGE